MLIALETIANALGRPFRLDFYFERTCGLTDHRNHVWAFERSISAGEPSKVFAGPFAFHMCVLPKVSAPA